MINGWTGVDGDQSTAEDGMKTLFTYGFARLTSKNINAITKIVKFLREVGTEYDLRVFQTQFCRVDHSEVRSLWEELTEKTFGILIAATLP